MEGSILQRGAGLVSNSSLNPIPSRDDTQNAVSLYAVVPPNPFFAAFDDFGHDPNDPTVTLRIRAG
jgi:hypothetical protein